MNYFKLKSKSILFYLSASTMFVALSFTNCSKSNDSNNAATESNTLLSNYTISSTGLYPESVDYDATNNRFIIGSFNKGAVYALALNGTLTSFVTGDATLVAVTGVFTDEKNNRLIVASSDAGLSEKSGANNSTAGQIAYVNIYNLSTGVLIKSINLKTLTPNGGAFPNDIAVDNDGNIYVTDSFSPIIYKLDKDYTATIFANNTNLFTPSTSTAFGLNGIVYSSDGYLIVAKTDNGKLYKVLLSDPTKITEVTGATGLANLDGLEWTADKKLIAIENGLGAGKVNVLSSSDNWTTATNTKSITIGQSEFPTTGTTTTDGSVYVINTFLGKFLNGDKTQSTFSLNKITLN